MSSDDTNTTVQTNKLNPQSNIASNIPSSPNDQTWYPHPSPSDSPFQYPPRSNWMMLYQMPGPSQSYRQNIYQLPGDHDLSGATTSASNSIGRSIGSNSSSNVCLNNNSSSNSVGNQIYSYDQHRLPERQAYGYRGHNEYTHLPTLSLDYQRSNLMVPVRNSFGAPIQYHPRLYSSSVDHRNVIQPTPPRPTHKEEQRFASNEQSRSLPNASHAVIHESRSQATARPFVSFPNSHSQCAFSMATHHDTTQTISNGQPSVPATLAPPVRHTRRPPAIRVKREKPPPPLSETEVHISYTSSGRAVRRRFPIHQSAELVASDDQKDEEESNDEELRSSDADYDEPSSDVEVDESDEDYDPELRTRRTVGSKKRVCIGRSQNAASYNRYLEKQYFSGEMGVHHTAHRLRKKKTSGMGSDDDTDDEEFYVEGRRQSDQRHASESDNEKIPRVQRYNVRERKRVNYNGVNNECVDSSEEDQTSETSDAEIDKRKITDSKIVGIDRVLKDKVENGTQYFFIKWLKRAHIHNSWETYLDIQNSNLTGLRKLDNYMKRVEDREEKRRHMTEDETEQDNIWLELQSNLDQDALIPERIFAWRSFEAGEEDWEWRPKCLEYLTVESDKVDSALSSPLLSSNLVKDENNLVEDEISHNISMTGHKSNDSCDDDLKTTPSGTALMKVDSGANGNSAEQCDTDGAASLAETCDLGLKADIPKCNSAAKDGKHSKEFIYVKWLNTAYDLATWELKETIVDLGYANLINEFEDQEDKTHGQQAANHPLNSHYLRRSNFEPYESTPFFFSRPLRDYQITGINWIISRIKKGLSVLPADEMGLGKTIQTLGVIGHIMQVELIAGPFLIVTPHSALDNWMREIQTWLPKANAVAYHGNPTAREILKNYELRLIPTQPYVHDRNKETRYRYSFDICLTTPSIMQCHDDLEYLRQVHWYMICIDEAHQLKNRDSKRFKEFKQFDCSYKLLLSGTPLHNHLGEIWSLLHFLNPQRFHDFKDFHAQFGEIEKFSSVGEAKESQLLSLQHMLQEIVLRRIKKDVEKSLPSKIERLLRVELTPAQQHWYKDVLSRNYTELVKKSGGVQVSLQNICMELKKVCNHVLLMYNPNDKKEYKNILIHGSGKLVLLDKLLNRLRHKGSRVLIFSQMVKMLDVISDLMMFRGYKFQRLDGSMSKEVRKKAMDNFNDPKSVDFCFLLSTKAGGLGINLTSADVVVIYDSDWNPQNDLQAEARAHRIGQTKTVHIYRLTTRDTIEENILERAKSKVVLDLLVIQSLNSKMEDSPSQLYTQGSSKITFSKDELRKIIRFGAQKLWDHEHASAEADFVDVCRKEPNVDLDQILAEAEETATDDTGIADQIFSSYTNVADFRYEAPEEEMSESEFWSRTIPTSQRVERFVEASSDFAELESSTASRKRGERVNRSAVASNIPALDDDTYNSLDDPDDDEYYESDDSAVRKAIKKSKKDVQPKKKNLRDKSADGRKRAAAAVFIEKKQKKLEKTNLAERTSSRRKVRVPPEIGEKDDTIPKKKDRSSEKKKQSTKKKRKDVDTGHHVELKHKQKDRVTQCLPLPSISQKSNLRLVRALLKFGHPKRRMDDVLNEAKLSESDEVSIERDDVIKGADLLLQLCKEKMGCSNKKSSKNNNVNEDADAVLFIGRSKHALKCAELVERLTLLEVSDRVFCEQNPENDRPWQLPISSSGSEEPVLVLKLPHNAEEVNSSCPVDTSWTRDADVALLKGVYVYGFGNWQKVNEDPNLSVRFEQNLSDTDYDWLKLRTLSLMRCMETSLAPDVEIDKKSKNGRRRSTSASSANSSHTSCSRPRKRTEVN